MVTIMGMRKSAAQPKTINQQKRITPFQRAGRRRRWTRMINCKSTINTISTALLARKTWLLAGN